MPELKNLVEVTPEIESLPSYVSFTKKRDLTAVRDAFDAGIRQIRESGRYDEIIRSYTPAVRNRPTHSLEKKAVGYCDR